MRIEHKYWSDVYFETFIKRQPPFKLIEIHESYHATYTIYKDFYNIRKAVKGPSGSGSFVNLYYED